MPEHTQSHSPAEVSAPTRAFSPFCCYVMPAARNQPIPYPKLSKPGHTHTTRHFVKPAGRWPVALAQVTQGGCGISLHPWRCSWDVLGSQLCTALPEHRVAPDDFQRSLPASTLLWFSCTHRSVKMPGTGDLIKCVWLFFFSPETEKGTVPSIVLTFLPTSCGRAPSLEMSSSSFVLTLIAAHGSTQAQVSILYLWSHCEFRHGQCHVHCQAHLPQKQHFLTADTHNSNPLAAQE